MTIRFFASIATMTILTFMGFMTSTATAQAKLPGSPQLTASSGSIQDLPPGSAVTFTLNIAANIAPSGPIDPQSITVQLLDANNNVIATGKITYIGMVGKPATSYNFQFTFIMPGAANTEYFIQYGGGWPGGGAFAGDVGIQTGNPG